MGLGIRGRLLLLVLVAIAPPTAIALGFALDERNEARRLAQEDVRDATRLAALDARARIDSTAAFVRALAEDVAAQPGRRHCERLLGTVLSASSSYRFIGVAAPDGRVVCHEHDPDMAMPPRRGVWDAGWFRRAQSARGFVLGEYGAGPVRDPGVLMVAHPVGWPHSERPGVLYAALDTARLARVGRFDARRGETDYLLLDDQGTVVVRAPAHAAMAGRRLPERPLVREVLRKRRGTAELRGLDGIERIHGFRPVGGRAGDRLLVVAGRSSASVTADPNRDLHRFLLLTALGLAVAFALGILVSKLLLGRWSAAVVESARRFGAGDLTTRAPVPRGAGELTDIAVALNAAAAGIERREAEHARLLAELVAAEEETRRRIALDIHDDTAQAVAAAGLRLDALAAALDDPEARQEAERARAVLAEANRRLRRLLFELRPPALDRAGLATALELFLTDSFGDDGFDWLVENRLEHEPSPEARAILYRVALEALTNVRKHAGASHVEVVLEHRGVGVAVTVRDDGSGFDLPPPDAVPQRGHVGLLSMRERAEAAGGRFALASRPGSGTTVDFWIPDRNGARPD